MPTTHRIPIALVGGAVLVLLLVPRHVDLPISWLSSSRLLGDAADGGTPLWWLLEDLANIAMFVPVGLVLARRLRPAVAVVAGCALSGTCELAQHWIPNRDGSVLDLAMNSIGTVLGVLLVLVLRRRSAAGYATLAAPQVGQDQKGAPVTASTASIGVRQEAQLGVLSAMSSSSAAAGSTTSSAPASASFPTRTW